LFQPVLSGGGVEPLLRFRIRAVEVRIAAAAAMQMRVMGV
jgi:hypothetical protein